MFLWSNSTTLPTPERFVPIYLWSYRIDTQWISLFTSAEIALFVNINMHHRCQPACLIYLARLGPQIPAVGNALQISFKGVVISDIEAGEGGKQP
jgi:hypothetical protein